MNIILDEAHNLINSRKSMSKQNVIMTDFLALARRILGESEYAGGDLILITQLNGRLDTVAREMATNYRYHLAHYYKVCQECGTVYSETSDMPEPVKTCRVCGGISLKKERLWVEVWHFKDEEAYLFWKYKGAETFHRHYKVKDLEPYFKMYDTLQWDNMLSEMY